MKKAGAAFYKLLQSGDFLVRAILFLGGSGIILAVAYILGFGYLAGIKGNDAMNAFNNIKWFASWWPRIPFWYPQQGSGVSLVWGYPILPSLMVILVSIWQKINLLTAFKILGFLSVPLTSIGMYLFVWRRFNNQTAGFIAGLFHLLMPVSWVWLFDWGFYAEHIAYIFLFPALLFYDRMLDGIINKDYGFLTRLSFFLGTIFWGLSFAAHPTVFFSGFRIIFIYSPIYFLLAKKKLSWRNLALSLLIPGATFMIAVLGTAYLTLGYRYYSAQGAWQTVRQETFSKKDEFVYFYSVPYKALTGLGKIADDDFKFTIRNLSIPPLVWSTAIVGTVLAFFISFKLVGLAVAGWMAFFILAKPEILYALSRVPFSLIGYFFTMRTDVVIVKMILPILSGFGIWGIPGLVLKALTFWIKFKNKILQWFVLNVRGVIASVAALGIAGLSIYYGSSIPGSLWKEMDVRYGPYDFDIRDPFNKFMLDNKCAREAVDSCREFAKDSLAKARYISYACEILQTSGQASDDCSKFLDISSQSYEIILTVITACKNGTDEPDKKELCPAPENKDKEREIKLTCETLKEKGISSDICRDYLDLAFNIQYMVNNFVDVCENGKARGNTAEICPLLAENKKQVVKYLFYALRDINNWPRMDFAQDFEFPFVFVKDFIQKYGQDQFLRIDVSPNLGGITQAFNMVSKVSFINLYTVQLNLLGPYWGHQQQVAFSLNDGRIETKNEIAKWFGTKYLFLNNGLDAADIYRGSSNWEAIYDQPGEGIFEYKQAPKLWTLTQGKPAILVVGSLEKRAFEPIFRASNKGALPFDEFMLVQGRDVLDSYSLEELKKFEILMLFGHKYKNRSKAYKLLKKYLDTGGNVFISAGWEFVDADWKIERVPDFFPIDKSSWTNDFVKEDSYIFDPDFLGGIDVSQFGPLIWNNTGWGVSVFDGVKPWGKTILSVKGKPLIVAGNYGKGKIVISGLNLIGHMHSFDYNSSEIAFFRKIFNYLGGAKVQDLSSQITAIRDYPDKITFTFSQPGENLDFYFRESYFPSWMATLKSNNDKKKITIYKAGPGYKLMHLPNVDKGSFLTLEFIPGFKYTLWILSSSIVYIVLFIYIIFGNRLNIQVPFLTNTYLKKIFHKIKDKISKSWGKDEDY